MSRTAARSTLSSVLVLGMLIGLGATTGCKELDARTKVRTGNRLYKESDYDGAAAEYEEALKVLDSPTVHYNLGLTYTKLFKPGADSPENKVLADKVATEFNAWLAANPTDTPTRDLMTQIWLDAGNYPKALSYWEDQLKGLPDNVEIMSKLAYINLKAGQWRDSMDWYEKVAAVQPAISGKALAYQSIGNVAAAKLGSNALTNADRIELADRGIGALERAAELEPTSLNNHSIIAGLYNFRSLVHGASWASALDRAASADQSRIQRVLVDEAKKAQALEAGARATGSGATPSPIPAPSVPAKAGG